MNSFASNVCFINYIILIFNHMTCIESSVNYQFMISPDHVCGTSPLVVHTDILNDMRCVRTCTKNVLCTFTHYCTVDDSCTLFTTPDDCSNSGSALCADGGKPKKTTLNDVSHIAASSQPTTASLPSASSFQSSSSATSSSSILTQTATSTISTPSSTTTTTTESTSSISAPTATSTISTPSSTTTTTMESTSSISAPTATSTISTPSSTTTTTTESTSSISTPTAASTISSQSSTTTESISSISTSIATAITSTSSSTTSVAHSSTTVGPSEELTWTFGYEFQSATNTSINSITDIITKVQESAEIRIVLSFDDIPDDAIIFSPDNMHIVSGESELCANFHHTLSLGVGDGFLQPPEHWLLGVCGTRLQQQKWSMLSHQDMQAFVHPAFVAKWFYRKRSSPLLTVYEMLTRGVVPDFEDLKVQMEKGYTFHVELNNQYYFTSKSHHFSATDACTQSIWDTSVSEVDGLMDVDNLWRIRQVCSSGPISILDIPIATTNDSSAKSVVISQSMKWKVNDYWELVYKHNTLGDDVSGSYAQLEAAFEMGRKIRIKTSNFSGAALTLYKSTGVITAVVANYFNPADDETVLSDTHIYRKYFIFSSSGNISVMNINVFDESVAYTDTYSTTNEDISWYADRDHWSVAFSASDSDNQKVLDAVYAGSDVTCLCHITGYDILIYPDAIMANNNVKTIAAAGFQTPMLDEVTPGVYNFRTEDSRMVHTFQAVFERDWLQNHVWEKGSSDIDTQTISSVCEWIIN